MEDNRIKVVLLCGEDISSRLMFNGLVSHASIVKVIVESRPSALSMIKRRIKRLGFYKVSGQVAFIFLNKLLAKISQKRVKQLIARFELNDTAIPLNLIEQVDSINDAETIALLKSIKPEAVVVNGTRIISPSVLSAIDAPFINTHAGITPQFRGVHGAYWSLCKKMPNQCGVTIHLVDEGIDTGGILYQDLIQPEKVDSFNTYPMHQLGKAIPLMRAALNDVKNKQMAIKPPASMRDSKLWYHPTLFEYLKNWILHGVK